MTPPVTQFESTGTWTTTANEAAFFSTMLAEQPKVSRFRFGTSAGSAPLLGYVVGAQRPAPDSLVIVCGQHAHEAAAREAALIVIRDLAYTENSAERQELEAHPVVIIPSLNADGVDGRLRVNSKGQDTNRYHVALGAPESFALARLVNSLDPVFVYDGHEGGSAFSGFQMMVNDHPHLAPPAWNDWRPSFFSVLGSQYPDVTYGPYPTPNNEGMLHNAMARRGVPALLVESLMTEAPVDRVEWHRRAIMCAFNYTRESRGALRLIIETGQRQAKDEGFYADTFWTLPNAGDGFGTDITFTADRPLAPALGYFVPAAHQGTLDALGLVSYQECSERGYVYVPAGQPLSMLVGPLCDPASPRALPGARAVSTGRPGVGMAPGSVGPEFRLGNHPPRQVIDSGGGLVWGW